MRTAETVLGIIRDRGTRGLPLEDVYRQLFNPELFLLAYWKISKNEGALTPGVDGQTADGMCREIIATIIEHLRHERYQWDPAKRAYIEKKRSKTMRPLGMPTWSDKLVQEVIRLILDAYYDPQFSDHAHGFRLGRGCGTALRQIHNQWKGTVWFIEGDIAGCFDRIDTEVLLSILAEKIHDNRFLRLIRAGFKAGYLEKGIWRPTRSGTPQGGIASPILANIYLARLDTFVEQTLIPATERGDHRATNPEYARLADQRLYWRRHGRPEVADALLKRMRQLPSQQVDDPGYRRLRYCRYADDVLLGFTGPRTEAEEIKHRLGEFLHDHLKLELSPDKTLITHGRTGHARFLNYEIHVLQDDSKHTRGKRVLNGQIGLRVPKDVIEDKCASYVRDGKPIHLPWLMNDDDYSIVASFQAVYRSTVNYWRQAYNLRDFAKLKWVMEISLLKTLAAKHKTTQGKIRRKYMTRVTTPTGTYKVLQVRVPREGKAPLVATWGAVPLIWSIQADIDTDPQPVWNLVTSTTLERQLADVCERCGSSDRVCVHHVRRLENLKRGPQPLPRWKVTMISRQRKKIALCAKCHAEAHSHDDRRYRRRAKTHRRRKLALAGAG